MTRASREWLGLAGALFRLVTKGTEIDDERVRRAVRRLWEQHDSGALKVARANLEKARSRTWSDRWAKAIVEEIERQFSAS